MPEAVLAIKLADIGDVVLTTPALDSLRAALPRARIDALVTPWTADLLRYSDLVDEIYTLDRRRLDVLACQPKPADLAYVARTVALLRGRYDAVILFHHLTTYLGTVKHGLITLAIGAPLRIGLDNGRGWWFLNLREEDQGFGVRHEAEYWLALASKLGGNPHQGRPRLGWRREDLDHVDGLLRSLRKPPLVCIAPGTGSFAPARRWPLQGFIEVARWVSDELKGSVVVIGSAAERPLGAQLASRLPPGQCLDLTGRTSLPQLAALLSLCHLYVGNDSGATQMAFAVGTPSVAIFGPSNVRAWGPFRNPTARVVQVQGLPCSPCLYRGHRVGLRFGCADRSCLTKIQASAVIETAMHLLKYGDGPRNI